jgi:predicted dehydrogenase
VVLEKPMGLRAAECQQLMDAAALANRQVFCVMQNRFTPAVQWLRQVLAEGRLGRLLLANVHCLWNRDARYYTQPNWKGTRQQDGGTLFTQFSHFIDLLYVLVGEVHTLHGSVQNATHGAAIEIEDTGHFTFRFGEQGMGTLSFTTSVWGRNLESSLTLVGEHGSVKLGGQYMNTVEQCHIRDYTLPELPPANPPNHYGAYQGSAANHGLFYQNVLDVLLHGATPSTTPQEGLAVVRIIEQLYAAAATP